MVKEETIKIWRSKVKRQSNDNSLKVALQVNQLLFIVIAVTQKAFCQISIKIYVMTRHLVRKTSV